MRKLIIIGVLGILAVARLSVYSQNAGVEGVWKIDQIRIKTISGGSGSEKSYYMSQEFKTSRECPERITLTESEAVFEFKGGRTITCSYSVTDGILKGKAATAVLEYKYQIQPANRIRLDYSSTVLGQEGAVSEEYTLFGHKE